jgi:hypothetical protein
VREGGVDVIGFVAALCIGLALAASAGLRAFLPLLVTGVAARVEWMPLAEPVRWLAETPALIALSVAVVLELVGDKVPAVDHALDAIQGPVRTAAGMLAFSAVFAPSAPTWCTALLTIVAGGAALSVHATKSFVRLGSTAATAGVGNPIMSAIEDVLSLVVSVLSVLVWAFAGLIALLALVWMVFGVRKLMRLRGVGPDERCPTREAPKPTT